MTDKLKAQVSAFLDDELLEEESELLVRRLCNDDELRQTALRYTLIGGALRGSLHQIDAGLAGNIRRVIDEEPVAPAVAVAAAPSRAPLWRAIGGGMVAATVAAVALVSVQQWRAPTPGDVAIAGTGSTEAPIVVPLDSSTPNDPFTGSAPAPVSQAGMQNQMNRYLLRHNQFVKTAGRQGVLAYLSMGTSDDATSTEQAREREDAGANAVVAPPAGADGQ